jgi:chorismate synthase
MKMIRFLTAGESHGKGLSIIIEGVPSNLTIEKDYIDYHLWRRQQGYGRGGRMKIESDKVEITAGIRFRKTLGSPIAFTIHNKDWKNWTGKMSPEDEKKSDIEKITVPRPGHADLVGVSKYNFDDIRNSIERSSARETAARVAAGSVARRYLEEFDVKVGSFVENIGGIFPETNFADKLFDNDIDKSFDAWELSETADKSSVRVLNNEHEEKIKEKIRKAKKRGDTLGGTFYVIASGLPMGLGSFVHYDRKLSSKIANNLMSINAVKGVEIGRGFNTGNEFGSDVHDEITFEEESFSRKTNNAGGLEGGITTGLPLIIRVSMKPISTLMSPIGTVDLANFEPIEARRERSDFVAVPACAVVAESMMTWTLAEFFAEKFGGDSMEEVKDNYNTYVTKIYDRVKNNFKK